MGFGGSVERLIASVFREGQSYLFVLSQIGNPRFIGAVKPAHGAQDFWNQSALQASELFGLGSYDPLPHWVTCQAIRGDMT